MFHSAQHDRVIFSPQKSRLLKIVRDRAVKSRGGGQKRNIPPTAVEPSAGCLSALHVLTAAHIREYVRDVVRLMVIPNGDLTSNPRRGNFRFGGLPLIESEPNGYSPFVLPNVREIRREDDGLEEISRAHRISG